MWYQQSDIRQDFSCYWTREAAKARLNKTLEVRAWPNMRACWGLTEYLYNLIRTFLSYARSQIWGIWPYKPANVCQMCSTSHASRLHSHFTGNISSQSWTYRCLYLSDAYTYQLSLLMKLSLQILLFLKGSNQLTLAKTQQVHSEQCVLEVRPVVIILKTERSAFKTFYGMKKFTAGILYCWKLITGKEEINLSIICISNKMRHKWRTASHEKETQGINIKQVVHWARKKCSPMDFILH